MTRPSKAVPVPSPATRPVLRYHGSKWRIAPWVMQFFPPHRVYVEPFGGGAAVLVRKPPAAVEVYNDLDDELVNLFRVLREPRLAKQLVAVLHRTPYARSELRQAWDIKGSRVERARRLLARAWMGFSSDSATRVGMPGFRLQTGAGRCSVHNWLSWQEALEGIVHRLRRVAIEHYDGLQVIERFDGPDSLFFVDPPYVISTRAAGAATGHSGYRHELTDQAHRDLAKTLNRVRGMVVLTGYPSEMYDRELYAGWQRHQTAARADHNAPRTEVAWLNPACAEALARAKLLP